MSLSKVPDKANEILELAWANYHAGDFENVLSQLEGLAPTGTYQKLKGLAHFQLGQYQAAQTSLHAFAKQTDAPLDWFSLSTTAAMAGQAALALEAFGHCKGKYPGSDAEKTLSLPLLHWYFLKAMVTAGFSSQLEPVLEFLVESFELAKITDSHYLSSRGLPDWEGFLEVLWPTLDALPPDNANAILTRLREAVDTPGRSSLNKRPSAN